MINAQNVVVGQTTILSRGR